MGKIPNCQSCGQKMTKGKVLSNREMGNITRYNCHLCNHSTTIFGDDTLDKRSVTKKELRVQDYKSGNRHGVFKIIPQLIPPFRVTKIKQFEPNVLKVGTKTTGDSGERPTYFNG